MERASTVIDGSLLLTTLLDMTSTRTGYPPSFVESNGCVRQLTFKTLGLLIYVAFHTTHFEEDTWIMNVFLYGKRRKGEKPFKKC